MVRQGPTRSDKCPTRSDKCGPSQAMSQVGPWLADLGQTWAMARVRVGSTGQADLGVQNSSFPAKPGEEMALQENGFSRKWLCRKMALQVQLTEPSGPRLGLASTQNMLTIGTDLKRGAGTDLSMGLEPTRGMLMIDRGRVGAMPRVGPCPCPGSGQGHAPGRAMADQHHGRQA